MTKNAGSDEMSESTRQMKTDNFIWRLLTLLSYFLPFIFLMPTCTDGLTMELAYNKKDALEQQTRKMEYDYSVLQSTIDSIRPGNKKEILAELRAKTFVSNPLKYYNQEFYYYLMRPTEASLSGIGAVYGHKNNLGKTAIALSTALSLISLFLWNFIQRRNLGKIVIFVNILAVLVFIGCSILTNVSLLFGTWTLLGLLAVQLLGHLRPENQAHHGQNTGRQNV